MFVFSVYVCTGKQTEGNGEVVYLLILAGIRLRHKDCSTFGVAAAKVLSSSVYICWCLVSGERFVMYDIDLEESGSVIEMIKSTAFFLR
jgi:hypothetical protein